MITVEIRACEACGQRHDPALGRSTWRAPSGRTGLRTRVGAQAIDTPGHRSGLHHRAHLRATELAREERVPLLAGHDVALPPCVLLAASLRTHEERWAPLDLGRSTSGAIRSLCAREAESCLVEIDEPRFRAVLVALIQTVQRVLVAREPWWIAWRTVLGFPASHIALGELVGQVRGDLWWGHEVLFARADTVVGTLPLFDRRAG